jgi:hypothetical protein
MRCRCYRFGNTLQSSSDVDAITENVVALDQDVAEVDPDPKQHTPILRDTFVPLGHHRLHGHRAFDRIDHRRKFEQHAVTRGLHEATTVFRHESVGNLAVFAECAGCADLVEAHEPRVACHVSRDYGRQPASDPNWLLMLHGQMPSDVIYARMTPVAVWALACASSTNVTIGLPRPRYSGFLETRFQNLTLKGVADLSRHFATR